MPSRWSTSDQKNIHILARAGLVELLDRHERAHDIPSHAERRKHIRAARRMCDASLSIDHIGGSTSTQTGGTRNISAKGVSLITSVFVHPQSPVEIVLTQNDGTPQTILGRTKHCRHLESRFHEVGINFASKINPLLFLQADDDIDITALEDKEHTQHLTGAIILITDTQSEIDLVEHYIRHTQLDLHVFQDSGPAIDCLKRNTIGAVLIDADIHHSDLLALPALFCSAGFLGDILLLTADNETARLASEIKHIREILSKPITSIALQSVLVRSIDRLGGAMNNDTLQSTLAADETLMPRLERYLEELHQLASLIESSLEEEDLKTLRLACVRIKGTCQGFGFDPLFKLANIALECVDNRAAVRANASRFQQLAHMCRKASI